MGLGFQSMIVPSRVSWAQGAACMQEGTCLQQAPSCISQHPLTSMDLPQPRLGLVQRQPLEHRLQQASKGAAHGHFAIGPNW